MRVQPDEALYVVASSKQPGISAGLASSEERRTPVAMGLRYAQTFGDGGPFVCGDAYERMLLNAARGEQCLSVSAAELVEAWRIFTPLLHQIDSEQPQPVLHPFGEFPEGYTGSRTIAELTALFDACFRLQREASEAAGRSIPMVVENVRGCVPWVGPAAWNYGSYYLWGDVPALMPQTIKAQKFNPDGTSHGQGSWFAIADSKNRGGSKNPGFRFDGSGKSFQSESVARHVDGVKQPGIGGMRENGKGDAWFQDGAARHGSKSPARKAASAKIAKIPLPLSQWIARTYKPARAAA
jgi:hypothetical protein